MYEMNVIGNLVADPRITEATLKTGEIVNVSNFRLAVNQGEKTYYVNCAAWRGLADVTKYLAKGRKVFASGIPTATANSYKEKIYANLNLSISRLEFLSPKPANMQGEAEAQAEDVPTSKEIVEVEKKAASVKKMPLRRPVPRSETREEQMDRDEEKYYDLDFDSASDWLF